MFKRFFVGIVLLLMINSTMAQFVEKTKPAQWFGFLKADTMVWIATTDTTKVSASKYPGALLFRRQPGDTGLYVSDGIKFMKVGASARTVYAGNGLNKVNDTMGLGPYYHGFTQLSGGAGDYLYFVNNSAVTGSNFSQVIGDGVLQQTAAGGGKSASLQIGAYTNTPGRRGVAMGWDDGGAYKPGVLVDSAGMRIAYNYTSDASLNGPIFHLSTLDSILRVQGLIKLTGGSPAAGKVLMSDAAGLGSWKYHFPFADAILNSDRVLTGKNNAYRLTLDSLLGFSAKTTGSGFALNIASNTGSLTNSSGSGITAGNSFVQVGVSSSNSTQYSGTAQIQSSPGYISVSTHDLSYYVDSATWNTPGQKIKYSAYKNNATRDSVLSVDQNGYQVLVKAGQPGFSDSLTALNLQRVTNNGNTTTNALQVTGQNKLPASGSGLEMYYDGSFAMIQGLNRTTSASVPLVLQAPGGRTYIHPYGAGRLIVNTATDDGSTALQVAGQAKISGGGPGTGRLFRSDAYGLGSWVDSSTYITSVQKGSANGVATLDASSKIPFSQIPDALVGAVVYQGNYNASTNSPALPAATGNKGNYWVVSTPGTQFSLTLAAGDWIISNGSVYQKVDNNNAVTSVAGRTGAVVIDTGDIGNFYTKVRTLISAGTGISYNNATGVVSNSGIVSMPTLQQVTTAGNTTTTDVTISGRLNVNNFVKTNVAPSSLGAAHYYLANTNLRSTLGLLNTETGVEGIGSDFYIAHYPNSGTADSAVIDLLVKRSTGNVGIGLGTTIPSFPLHVGGIISSSHNPILGTTELIATNNDSLASTKFVKNVVNSIGLGTGTSGTDVNWSSSNLATSTTATLNIPSASATARGLINTGTQILGGAKTFLNNPMVNSSSGGAVILQDGSASNVLFIGADKAAFGGSSSDGVGFVYGNNKYHIATNSIRRMTVDGSGNVGIGTVSPASKFEVSGSVSLPIRTITSSTTLDVNDHTVVSVATSGNPTITLPAANSCAGRVYVLVEEAPNVTSNGMSFSTVTYKNNTYTNFNNQPLSGFSRLTVQSDGSKWLVISGL